MFSLFVDMDIDGKESPLTKTIYLMLSSMYKAEKVADGDDAEADLVVINSADKALSFYKETESSMIVIAYFGREAAVPACALAARFPDRIKAVALFDHDAESDSNTFITRIATVCEAVKTAKGIK